LVGVDGPHAHDLVPQAVQIHDYGANAAVSSESLFQSLSDEVNLSLESKFFMVLLE
jgi:hypothetical protein